MEDYIYWESITISVWLKYRECSSENSGVGSWQRKTENISIGNG